jgi:hypothetical protein
MISSQEDNASTVLGVIGWLIVTILVVGRMFVEGVHRHNRDSRLDRFFQRHNQHRGVVFILVLAIVPLLMVSQAWSFFRWQKLQRDMTAAAGTAFIDEAWTFGQIVASTAFAPVFIQTWHLFQHKDLLQNLAGSRKVSED